MALENLLTLLKNLIIFSSYMTEKSSFPKPLSKEKEQEYLKKSASGDKEAKEILVKHNLRLVAHIAKKYANYGDNDELISIGSIGLMKAIESFKSDKGTSLATYASRCIENEILMTMRTSKKHRSNVSLNEPIGVDKDGNSLETICEFAQKYDMKTGLVDRHYVCHATPAGMAAHNSNRGNYVQILRDMAKTGVNVMFGGGEQYYKDSNKTKNYINEKGYKFIDTEEQLLALDGSDDKVLGMFAYENMKNAYREPTLTTMTSKALDLLDNDKGFFLMVEGSNIDVCESEQDMKGTIEQMMAFDHTVDYVLNWAQQHPGTLVLVTADHETGGVQIPDNATADDINNDCFTSDGEHTNTNVLLMAGGAQSAEICSSDVIDNTDIAKYMRKVLTDSHK